MPGPTSHQIDAKGDFRGTLRREGSHRRWMRINRLGLEVDHTVLVHARSVALGHLRVCNIDQDLWKCLQVEPGPSENDCF